MFRGCHFLVASFISASFFVSGSLFVVTLGFVMSALFASFASAFAASSAAATAAISPVNITVDLPHMPSAMRIWARFTYAVLADVSAAFIAAAPE